MDTFPTPGGGGGGGGGGWKWVTPFLKNTLVELFSIEITIFVTTNLFLSEESLFGTLVHSFFSLCLFDSEEYT